MINSALVPIPVRIYTCLFFFRLTAAVYMDKTIDVRLLPCNRTQNQSGESNHHVTFTYNFRTNQASLWLLENNEQSREVLSWSETREKSTQYASTMVRPEEVAVHCDVVGALIRTLICDPEVCYYTAIEYNPRLRTNFSTVQSASKQVQVNSLLLSSHVLLEGTLSYLASPIKLSTHQTTSFLLSISFATQKNAANPKIYNHIGLIDAGRFQGFGPGLTSDFQTAPLATQTQGGHVAAVQLLQFVSSDSRYAYVVRSGEVDLPQVYGQNSRWLVQLGRICLDDPTKQLRSYLEMTLSCSKNGEEEYIASIATIANKNTELYLYCEPIEHGANSLLAHKLEHLIIRYNLTELMEDFDRIWTTCQRTTDTDSSKCTRSSTNDYCAIRSLFQTDFSHCSKFGGADKRVDSSNSCQLTNSTVFNQFTHLVNTTVNFGTVVSKITLESHDRVFGATEQEKEGHGIQMVIDGKTANILYDYGYWARVSLNESLTSSDGNAEYVAKPLINRPLSSSNKNIQAALLNDGFVLYDTEKLTMSWIGLEECTERYRTQQELIASKGLDGCVWCIRERTAVPTGFCQGAYVTTTDAPEIKTANLSHNDVEVIGLHFLSFETVRAEVCRQPCDINKQSASQILCTPTNVLTETDSCMVNLTGTVEGRLYSVHYPFTRAVTQTPGPSNTTTLSIILAVCAALVVIALLALVFIRRKASKKARHGDGDSSTVLPIGLEERHQNGRHNRYEMRPGPSVSGSDARATYYEDLHILVPEHIRIPDDRIRFDMQIGQGNFGMVYKATLLPAADTAQPEQKVAVKTLRAHAGGYREFLKEGLLMEHFNHPRVMHLLGISFTPENQPMIITTFMERGDLYSFMRNTSNAITLGQLLNFTVEIAEGMQYLHKLRFVHRDLAARNCMLDEQQHIKISDFGLCRDIYDNDLYQAVTVDRSLPIRWLAPESIGTLEFTYKGDVWAYGVTVWECMTRGSLPYEGIDGQYLAEFLLDGGRLDCPPYCPEIVYTDIMLPCWEKESIRRPTFEDLCLDVPTVIERINQAADAPQVHSQNYERVGTMRSSSGAYRAAR